MASSLSSIAAKDGTGTTVAGGILAVDKSGASTGPFFAAQAIVDPQGVNTAAVKAASTAPVAGDPALVVSLSPNSVNANGQATMANSAPVVIASNQTTLPISIAAATSGGLTIKSTLIASGTNATSVKASAGQLYKIEVTNNSTNIGYLKLYNTASAPTAGSGTPVIRIMCPASGGAFSTFADVGVPFSTGIGFTFTGGIADADTTSVAASAFIVNLYYA